MNKSAVTKIQAILIVALIVVSVGAVSIYWWYSQPKAFSTLMGKVFLDEPIVGATISIYDMDGVKIFEENGTYETGSFNIEVPWGIGRWDSILTDFKIVATGGTLNNESFTGTLTRIVHDYDEEDYYKINAISTLIANYLEDYEMDYSEAEEAVEQFLEIPTGFTLSEIIDSSDYYHVIFDHASFMLAASSDGGFDVYIDTLVDELDDGLIHPFQGTPKGWASFAFKTFKFVGSGLLEGALGSVGEMAMGWIMRELGYKDTDAKLDEMNKKLDEVLADLKEIKREMEQIKEEISELKNAIEELEEELKLNEIRIKASEAIQIIEESYTTLKMWAESKNITKSTLENFRTDVLSTTTGIYQRLGALHDYIVGHVDLLEDGLLDMLTQKVIHKVDWQYGEIEFEQSYDTFRKYYEYLENLFSSLLLVQLKGLNLIVEAHLYNHENIVAQNYIKEIFQPRIEQQVETFLMIVEKLVFSAHPNYLSELPNMGPIPEFLDEYEYYSNVRPYLAQIFPRADYVSDYALNGTGAFTVRVLFSTHIDDPNYIYRIPEPEEIPITIQNNATGETYTATGRLRSTDVEEIHWYPDPNNGSPEPAWWAYGHKNLTIMYYNFSGIPAGYYKLISPIDYTSKAGSDTGWVTQISNYDISPVGWNLEKGYQMSKGTDVYGYGISGSFIEIINDENGYPYGHWGGYWRQEKPYGG